MADARKHIFAPVILIPDDLNVR